MLAVIWKDIVLEARSRDTIASLFVLGVMILAVFNFALDIAPANVARIAPGLLWSAIVLCATLALGRTFLIERENSALTGLLLSPVDRGSIFLAKLTSNFLLLVVFEVMLLPVYVVMFDLDVTVAFPGIVAILIAGDIGLSAVGTLFALAAHGTRARELMLPLLVLPLQIPLMIAAVKSTSIVLSGQPLADIGVWGTLILSFDVLFVTAGWLAFEFVSVD